MYYHFAGKPAQEVTDKLLEYEKRYGIDLIIDLNPF